MSWPRHASASSSRANRGSHSPGASTSAAIAGCREYRRYDRADASQTGTGGAEHATHVDRKTGEHSGSCHAAAPEDTMVSIRTIDEPEDDNRLIERVHNPVFRDTRLSIIASLFDKIARRFVGTDNLQYEVGTKPIAILPS